MTRGDMLSIVRIRSHWKMCLSWLSSKMATNLMKRKKNLRIQTLIPPKKKRKRKQKTKRKRRPQSSHH